MKTFLLATFFFKFSTLYNKSNLILSRDYCTSAVKWQNSPKWESKRMRGKKKRKKISHNHFFTKYMWSGIDCSCCQLKCSLATIMAQWKYKMAHHVYQALLLQTPIKCTCKQILWTQTAHTYHLWQSTKVFTCSQKIAMC